MQTQALQLLVTLEDPPGHQDLTKGPIGSGCYQTDGQALLVDTTRLGQLFTGRKGSRVAFGFIGGVKPTGPADGDKKYISGVADDCSGSGATPSYVCSCVTPVPATSDLDSRWCSYTQDTSYPPATTCDALAGNRYVKTMRDNFSRLTYDSICQADYGGALQAFAKKLISACFEIDVDVRPANDDPSNIEVIRTPKADQGSNATPSTVTPLADCNEAGPGWCYIPPIIPASTDTNTKIQRPQVCLVGFDRLIGDVYDIFILSTNYFDASR
jgi:hypothetical protein